MRTVRSLTVYKDQTMNRDLYVNWGKLKTPLRTLPAIATGAMLAVLIWPATRPIVVRQFRLLVPTPSAIAAVSFASYVDQQHSHSIDSQLQAAASSHPNNSGIQIAAAITDTPSNGTLDTNVKIRHMQVVMKQFPDSPDVCAEMLRLYCLGRVRISRKEFGDFFLPPGAESQYKSSVPRPSFEQDLNDYMAVCKRGERLDPDNAVFPLLESIALFEARRDREAIDALIKSSKSTRWDEYVQTEYRGLCDLHEAAFGTISPETSSGLAAMILLPHYAGIRAAARGAVYEAAMLEKQGQIDKGLEIRSAVLKIGELMRVNSRNAIGNLVGIALEGLSVAKPAALDTIVIIEKDSIAGAKITGEKFAKFEQAHGRAAAADAFVTELKTCTKTKEILSRGLRGSVFSGSAINDAVIANIVNMIPLCSAVWILGLALCVMVLGRAVASRTVCAIPSGARNALFSFVCLFTICAMAAVLTWYTLRTTGVFVTVLTIIGNMSNVMDNLTESQGSPTKGFNLSIARLYVPIILSVPAFVTCALIGFQRVRWRPVISGIASMVPWITAPVVGLLLIVYCLTLPSTASKERLLSDGLAQTVAHEGRYAAKLIGKEWPN